jgi:esterase/lipase
VSVKKKSLFILALVSLRLYAPPLVPDALTDQITSQTATTGENHGLDPILLWNQENTRCFVLFHDVFESPSSLRAIAEAQFAKGYNVYVPLLPLHGDKLKGIENTTSQTFPKFIRDQVAIVTGTGQEITLAGTGMGGLMVADYLIREAKSLPSEVKHFSFISATMEENGKVANEGRTKFYSKTVAKKLQVAHGEATVDSLRAEKISYAVVDAMDAMRDSFKSPGKVQLPTGVTAVVFTNVNDPRHSANGERMLYDKFAGERDIVALSGAQDQNEFLGTGVLHSIIQSGAHALHGLAGCARRLSEVAIPPPALAPQ